MSIPDLKWALLGHGPYCNRRPCSLRWTQRSCHGRLDNFIYRTPQVAAHFIELNQQINRVRKVSWRKMVWVRTWSQKMDLRRKENEVNEWLQSNQGMYFRRLTIDDIPPASYLDEGPEDDMRYKFTYSTAATVTSHLYITHQLVNFTYISSPCLFALCWYNPDARP